MPPIDVYRVRVSHDDADHHMSAESFHGPAFDAHYQDTVEAALGSPVDLEAHAKTHAEKCRAEHPDSDGFTTRVVRLHESEPDENGETTGDWVEVV